MKRATDCLDVSEVAGEPISAEQLQRLHNRYMWAREYCRDRDVIEVACGTGPGLSLLNNVAKSFEGSDSSQTMVDIARRHYEDRVVIRRIDAQELPYANSSKDVIIIFEALYYLTDIEGFIRECKRVLRRWGHVLVCVANKDVSDFNPSPHSVVYLGAQELDEYFSRHGFSATCFGYLSTDAVFVRQRIFRPLKKMAVSLGLMPKTMKGKRLLKRLVFGKLLTMPAELDEHSGVFTAPRVIPKGQQDYRHKVIYCAAQLLLAQSFISN